MLTPPEACLLQKCGCRPKHPMRCALVCSRARWQGRCGAVASWQRRSSRARSQTHRQQARASGACPIFKTALKVVVPAPMPLSGSSTWRRFRPCRCICESCFSNQKISRWFGDLIDEKWAVIPRFFQLQPHAAPIARHGSVSGPLIGDENGGQALGLHHREPGFFLLRRTRPAGSGTG
jgi:hypothetical protein